MIASADGVVVSVTGDTKYGTEVVIHHDLARSEADDVYRTGYLHLRSAAVHVGQRVARGQKIGEVGLFWGSDEIVHVHWRLWFHGKTMDPVSKAVGCFARGNAYSDSTLELTFPLRC